MEEREGGLWDDSALINAFDGAISKYKKMHGIGYKGNLNTSAADVKNCNSDALDASQEDKSKPEQLDGSNYNGLHAIPEVGETETLEAAKGNEVADSDVPVEHAPGSNGFPLQDQSWNHSTSVEMDEYNELCKQYYEIEEQRQKILQNLQQNYSNYYSNFSQPPTCGWQWGTYPAVQEYQSSISQVPCGGMAISCCPRVCQYSMASCSSLPCPSAGVSATNLCVDPCATKDLVKKPAMEDGDIVKTAMGVAEIAISTLKNQTSDSNENKISEGAEQNANSGTDLSIVLNAWYSAGLYTGKYLTEQSLAKKQHD